MNMATNARSFRAPPAADIRSGPRRVVAWHDCRDRWQRGRGAHRHPAAGRFLYSDACSRRSPGFALTAVLIVALGIGATTAAFSVTDFVLLRPLPFPEPDRLVTVVERDAWDTTIWSFPVPNYRDWKAAATSFESMGIYHGEQITVFGAGEPRRWTGASVSSDLLPTLGVAPMVDADSPRRTIAKERQATFVLSYRLWQTEFGGDPAIIGRALSAQADFDTAVFTGASASCRASSGFRTRTIEFWITNRFGATRSTPKKSAPNNWLDGVGRLKRGVHPGASARGNGPDRRAIGAGRIRLRTRTPALQLIR